MRNRRLVRIRPGGQRIVHPPLWPAIQDSCGLIGKSLGWFGNHIPGLRALEIRP
jgi:hypothetical protein